MTKRIITAMLVALYVILVVVWIKLVPEICSKDVGVKHNPTDFIGTGIFNPERR